MPAGRPQPRSRADAGRTRYRRGPDAGRTHLRALADAGETRFARVSDAVFDKLFPGSTVHFRLFIIFKALEFAEKMFESHLEQISKSNAEYVNEWFEVK